MMSPHTINRRRFLQCTGAAAIGGLAGLRLSRAAAVSGKGENDHFFYRLAPEGPYIDSQRDNKAFGFGGGKIYLSDDNAKSWAHSAEFADADNIGFSVILKNGNVLFATQNKLFLSTDNLKTHRQIIVKDLEGKDYVPHTPKDPKLPGWYFHPLEGVRSFDVNGKEMLVWGNYCNVVGGMVPVNIYYSVDGGETVKIAYAFGRNPHFQQKGEKPEAFLGNPNNPIICRHVHSVQYHAAENAFYACTGDIDRGHGHECHWLRGTYDAKSDKWDWKVLISTNSNSRYKAGGINFVDGQLYWVSDANGVKIDDKYDRGVFRCAPGDLTDPSKHTKLFPAPFEMGNMLVQDRVMFGGHCAPASDLACGIAWSSDLGKNWIEYDLAELGHRSPCRFHHKNADGWFRMDLRVKWIDRGEVLFIKPKA